MLLHDLDHTTFTLHASSTKTTCSLQANFEAALAEKASLAASTALTQDRMDAAEKLLAALAGEASRWRTEQAQFNEVIRKLAGMDQIVAFASL